MTRLLASVRDEDEAEIALGGGADIIDFKDPARGALGALPAPVIERGVQRVAGRAPTSATAGDWALEPAALTRAVAAIAATGVDYVKLGLLPGAALHGCIRALAPLAARHRLVAVFFADRGVSHDALPGLRSAGFAGAMIDTFDKSNGSLREYLSNDMLREFVGSCRNLGLMAGLAGSLHLRDVAPLAALRPDLLGFRGALCGAAGRNGPLSAERVKLVREAFELAAPDPAPSVAGMR